MEVRGKVYLDCELAQWAQTLDVYLRVILQKGLINK